MGKQLSFSKHENALLPSFRERMSQAESTEDVKKFFAYAAEELVKNCVEADLDWRYEDISLDPTSEPGFTVSERLRAIPEFTSAWEASDLPNIFERFATNAVNSYRHLEKNPGKTESKMYPIPDKTPRSSGA